MGGAIFNDSYRSKADIQLHLPSFRSWPISAGQSHPNLLVKSNANDWLSRMQMGGQVHAIT